MLLSSYMCQKYTEDTRSAEGANSVIQKLLLLRMTKPLISIHRLWCPDSSAGPCGPHDLLLSAGILARQWAKPVRPSVLTHRPLMPAAGDYQSRKLGGDAVSEPEPPERRAVPHGLPRAPSGSCSVGRGLCRPGRRHVALGVESAEVAGFCSQNCAGF